MEGDEVVQLERSPRPPELWIEVGVIGGVECLHRDLMGFHVIGVGIPAVLVIGEDDVRAELADQADQRRRRVLEFLQREAPIRQRRWRIALRQTRVHEPEELLPDTQDVPRAGHLLLPDRRQIGTHLRALHRLVQDVPAFAAGHRGDQDVRSAPDITGHGGRALAGFVVGMGMHRQQAQPGPLPLAGAP